MSAHSGKPRTDTPIAAGSANTYHVVAIDGSGNTSAASDTASATTSSPDTTAPWTPTSVTASATTWGSATLSWIAGTDNAGVTSYTISRNSTVPHWV